MSNARYRKALPQLGEGLFITDGGIETTLIFREGLDLPDFAAFDLLRRPAGEQALRTYFLGYAEIARRYSLGLVLETATWRASADWGARLGYAPDELAEANRRAVALLEDIRREYGDPQEPSPAVDVVISGCVGPRGDGYHPTLLMSDAEAEAYHGTQIDTFAGTAADLVTAMTMNYVEEAIGIARAAQRVAMPVVIAFTVETDGRLVTGQTLQSAIEQVDRATGEAPVYYMINCAHPTHFAPAVREPALWVDRIRGLRANASAMSHAELNEAPVLDEGNPDELAAQYVQLRAGLRGLTVMGGCCGTDERHIDAIARACVPLFNAGIGSSA